MTKPSPPQLRALIAAVRNSGRLPAGTCAYAGYFRPYAGTEKIQEVLAKAAKSRRAQAEMILATELTHSQLLMAGGFLAVDRRSTDGIGTDGIGTLAHRYATAIHNGHGRIDRVTAQSVKACIRHGWLTDTWEITTDGRDAAQAAAPESYAQAMPDDQPTIDQDHDDALREHYYLLRDEHIAAGGIVVAAERRVRDGDYAGAVQWLCEARGSDFRNDSPAGRQRSRHHLAADTTTDVPDGLVQYDVPLDQAENFVGYQIRVGTDLEILAGVRLKRAGKALALYISDGWDGMKCVGTVYDTDFPVFGPAGGPDLHHRAATTQQNPITVVIDKVAEHLGTDRTGAVRELMDEIMREGRDNTIVVADDALSRMGQYPTVEAMTAAISGHVDRRPRNVTMGLTLDRWPALSYAGETGSGKTYPHYADPVNVAAAMTGHRTADLTRAERAALAEGIPPTVRDRLMPAVNPDLVDELRPRYWYLRDGIAAELAGMGTAEGLAAHRLTDQDPCAEGYRLAVHRARTMPGLPERVRQALFHFQVSLTSAAHGHRGIALTAIDKATAKLGIPSYAEAV